MKLTFLITDISQKGGIERVTAMLSKKLYEEGYDVSIISLFCEFDEFSFKIDNNVNVTVLNNTTYNCRQSNFRRIKGLLKSIKCLRKYLIGFNCDAFIAQGYLNALILYLLGLGNKTIVCEHFKYGIYKNPILRKMRDFVYHKVSKVITLTQADADKYKRDGIETVVIPNMIPFPKISILSRGIRESRTILCIGRLEYEKGFDLLIRSISLIKKKLAGWEIHIFGEGSEKDNLQSLISELKCSDIIKLNGFSNNIDYSGYSFTVMSSRHEGFPMTLLECMAKGLPVVAFNCQEGPRILLSDGTGLLVDEGNIEKLSKGILEMVEDEHKRITYAKKSLARVDNYTPSVIIKKWNSILKSYEPTN